MITRSATRCAKPTSWVTTTMELAGDPDEVAYRYMLVSSFGMLYLLSGRLITGAFVFATLIGHSSHRP